MPVGSCQWDQPAKVTSIPPSLSTGSPSCHHTLPCFSPTVPLTPVCAPAMSPMATWRCCLQLGLITAPSEAAGKPDAGAKTSLQKCGDQSLCVGGTGPCITTAVWCSCKNFSQWQCSFRWKLRSHWLKLLWQHHVALVIQGPGSHTRLIGRIMAQSTLT